MTNDRSDSFLVTEYAKSAAAERLPNSASLGTIPAFGRNPTHFTHPQPREREILALVARGMSNPEIAATLSLSEHTANRHVANILLKLDLKSRAAAAALFGSA